MHGLAPPGGGVANWEEAAAAGPAPASSTAPSAPPRSRWASPIKVYYRKYPRRNPKPPPPPPPGPAPDLNPLPETLSSIPRPIRCPEDGVAAAAPSSTPPPFPDPAAPISTPPPFPDPAATSSTTPPFPDPAAPTSSSPAPPLAPAPPGEPSPGSGDIAPGINRDGAAVPNGHGKDWAMVAVQKAEKAKKRRARSELRRQLASELDQAAFAPFRSLPPQAPLTVSVVHTEPFEVEKRTPKANQLYQNSEFLLAKDKFPPADTHGRKKPKHHKKKNRSLEPRGADFDAERRLYSHAFKKSSSLLSRLMKHKFAWVFNKPVDAVGLGLHDYFEIIRHPMDLGTIRGRLSHGQYRNPKEFAEDVRLTFQNAMTYNPKGHDVHIMAEQLLGIFEAQWPEIEAKVNYLALCPPLPKKFPPPPIDLRLLERSDSVKHHVALESNSRPISHTPTRPPSMKKPRAKDANKRDMTMDEKRKLSENLQNLPPEKLDAVVQLIKNKNLTVRQHDDEIEVEIDSMDAETLWELDRFVSNYKKNLSKQKRRAERAMLARQDAELRAQHSVQQLLAEERNTGEKSPKQNVMVGGQLASSAPNQNDNNGHVASRSNSSSGSSSDSGSSSSDSDSDSSSSDGSDAANLS
uniref:Bromo domain-containing protein n=1 Tax=Setaria viridis TaxID=4556 RepID=A0A4U6W3B2_SETVI|nr:hypothetical protein SEVIR_1G016300v2 [Setaria viridis]